jgi:hypothetical protein
MAKRQKGVAKAFREQGEPVTFKTHAEEARERLGITPEQMRGVPRIAPLLEPVEGGIERIVEALRWSEDCTAVAFLNKYDSVPQADLKHLSVEEICVAAGVEPTQLLSLAVDGLMHISLNMAKLQVFSSLPGIMRATIKSALKDKGWRDRRLIFQALGFLPVPSGCTGLLTLQQITNRPARSDSGERPHSHLGLPAAKQRALTDTSDTLNARPRRCRPF